MMYKLKIYPAINIVHRHRIVKLLEELNYHTIGTGQMVDGSECDITFEDKENPK